MKQTPIYLTLHEGNLMQRFLPSPLLEALASRGPLRRNTLPRVLTEAELASELKDAEIAVVMPWEGSPRFTLEVLDRASRLKLLVGLGGSVSRFATEEVYNRGISVCSANDVMARYVAEGTLAYILAGLRDIPLRDRMMRKGVWDRTERMSFIGKRLGLVGLGSVGKHLLHFLKPFDLEIRIYDPYRSPKELAEWENVSLVPLEEVLRQSDVVSIHASLTPETCGMLSASQLQLLPDGALLVNTARGALIDENALVQELESGRIRAVLDVFENDQALPEDCKLRNLDSVVLMPHAAGNVELTELTKAMLQEIDRFLRGDELQYRIPVEQFRKMTVQ